MAEAIVVSEHELVPLDEVERHLAALVESGDTDALFEGRAKAEAYAAYERRQGALERANYFGRIKILSEASLGYLDLEERPFASSGPLLGGPLPPLVVAGVPITDNDRGLWRVLGQGQIQGLLNGALDTVEADEQRYGCGTRIVVLELRRLGAGWIAVEPFRSRVVELRQREGWTYKELGRRVGLPGESIKMVIAKKRKRVSYRVAAQTVTSLGLDPALLRPEPPSKRSGRNRLSTQRRLKGGRWDRAYSSHRRTMEEVFGITGESGDPDLWAHLHAVEDFFKRRV